MNQNHIVFDVTLFGIFFYQVRLHADGIIIIMDGSFQHFHIPAEIQSGRRIYAVHFVVGLQEGIPFHRLIGINLSGS